MRVTIDLTEKEIDLLFDTVEMAMHSRIERAITKKGKQQASDDFHDFWNINEKIAQAIDHDSIDKQGFTTVEYNGKIVII